jgi:DNA-binding NtrC family response regulator
MILLVDDDPSVTASLALLLSREGYEVAEAQSPAEAMKTLERGGFRLVLQDMNFSRDTTGKEGLELLRSIKERSSELPVILMTAWGSIELAVSGMKAGAADFVTKPWSNEQLVKTVETAIDLAASRARSGTPDREALDAAFELDAIVGRDPKLLRLLDLVGRVAPTDASVLITGESGTGKELLAEAVHRNSKRRDGPFVKVNLGGISSTLFESEMFGHVRGAFTGARRNREGRFAVASGGSIFLDEIGEVDRNAQVKLLRVLQDRSFEVLGSSRPQRADVRVISATNRDLAVMVGEGSFREDLLYRLNLISIELPPLRERPGDIPLLAAHFAERCGESYGRPELELTSGALAWLRDQRWPGNVRQLRQVIERAVLVGPNAATGRLEAEDLEPLTESGARPAESALPAAGEMTLEELERAMIKKALDRFDGNVSKASRALGLSRAALYRRCEKFGLEPGSARAPDDS